MGGIIEIPDDAVDSVLDALALLADAVDDVAEREVAA